MCDVGAGALVCPSSDNRRDVRDDVVTVPTRVSRVAWAGTRTAPRVSPAAWPPRRSVHESAQPRWALSLSATQSSSRSCSAPGARVCRCPSLRRGSSRIASESQGSLAWDSDNCPTMLALDWPRARAWQPLLSLDGGPRSQLPSIPRCVSPIAKPSKRGRDLGCRPWITRSFGLSR
jgi:hypothetical protein